MIVHTGYENVYKNSILILKKKVFMIMKWIRKITKNDYIRVCNKFTIKKVLVLENASTWTGFWTHCHLQRINGSVNKVHNLIPICAHHNFMNW